MCAPCCSGCGGCPGNCCPDSCCPASCCMPSCCGCKVSSKPPMEKLKPAALYRWFENCSTAVCHKCQKSDKNAAEEPCCCPCDRNRHIIEAFSCLFGCSMQQVLSVLFKLVYHQNHPVKRLSRDRVWDVMANVKAPYSELHDLEIYDSMYDRCGNPINPLDIDNMYKILRMMFLGPVLTAEHQKYLMQMLQCLNDHSNCPVHLELLLETLNGLELKAMVCSLFHQDVLSQRLFMARECKQLCSLYRKVASVDKAAIKRRRISDGHKTPERCEEARRPSDLQRQYCERRQDRPIDFGISGPVNANVVQSADR